MASEVSKNGPVTTITQKSAEEVKAKGTRPRELDFNRWEKEFLNLAFPVRGITVVGNSDPEKGPLTEDVIGIVAYDLFAHVPVHSVDAEQQLLTSFDEKAKAEWTSAPEFLKKMALEQFASKLPKSEFPNNGDTDELPLAAMRIYPYGSWDLRPRDISRDYVDDHIAELAVKFASAIRPKLLKYRRGIETLEVVIEAFGFYMAEVDEDSGTWTSRARKLNEDLAADLNDLSPKLR